MSIKLLGLVPAVIICLFVIRKGLPVFLEDRFLGKATFEEMVCSILLLFAFIALSVIGLDWALS